jgi:hypothetical protein
MRAQLTESFAGDGRLDDTGYKKLGPNECASASFLGGPGWYAPAAPGASAAFPSRQPRRHSVGFAHQAIECRLAGLGHWFVRHSQSGDWTAGFGGLLFGLECRRPRRRRLIRLLFAGWLRAATVVRLGASQCLERGRR